MQVQGFYPDTDGLFDTFTDNKEENVGFVERMDLFSKMQPIKDKPDEERVWSDKSVYLCGPLPTDFNATNAPIINGVALRLEFVVATDDFVLKSSEDTDAAKGARIILEDVAILCPVGEMNDVPSANLIKRLQREAVIFQFRRRYDEALLKPGAPCLFTFFFSAYLEWSCPSVSRRIRSNSSWILYIQRGLCRAEFASVLCWRKPLEAIES